MESTTPAKPRLGSLLRALLDGLDGEVERLYQEEGSGFRPKYYPLAVILLRDRRVSISHLAAECSVTHSALSQTVSEMAARGLVETRPGKDARERLVALTAKGRRACADLAPLWEAIGAAAAELDAELEVPLSRIATDALGALARRPFRDRIREQRSRASQRGTKS